MRPACRPALRAEGDTVLLSLAAAFPKPFPDHNQLFYKWRIRAVLTFSTPANFPGGSAPRTPWRVVTGVAKSPGRQWWSRRISTGLGALPALSRLVQPSAGEAATTSCRPRRDVREGLQGAPTAMTVREPPCQQRTVGKA